MSYRTVPIMRGIANNTGSIAVDHLNRIISAGGVIAGGFARYCCSTARDVAPASDIDVYAISMSAFDGLTTLLDSMCGSFTKETGISYNWTGDFLSLQLIKPVEEGNLVTVGDPETIMSTYDFTVCKAAIISSTLCLVDERFSVDEAKKFLRIRKMGNPLSTLNRVIKYTKKGYSTNNFQLMKILKEWDAHKESFKSDLEQLVVKQDKGELVEADSEVLYSMMRGEGFSVV